MKKDALMQEFENLKIENANQVLVEQPLNGILPKSKFLQLPPKQTLEVVL